MTDMHDNTVMSSNMHRKMPTTDQLPYALYTAQQVRHFDQLAIGHYGIPGAELMQRAGQTAFDTLCKRWPQASRITVVTGSGNNAGDGFVVARLALEAGMTVEVLQLGDREKLSDDAMHHVQLFDAISNESNVVDELPKTTDIIVDAILGTGLNSPVKGRWHNVIEAINQHPAPVLSLDIPSGLNADTGAVMGIAVKADVTVSFIGLKQGMFTGAANDYCGDIQFNALEIPARIYASEILSSRRIDWQKMKPLINPRPRTAHKGYFGHVLIIGGNVGFSGAARLAAEAAARSGAGLVSVATHASHAAELNIGCPELMVHPVMSVNELEPLLERAGIIVFGPGAGKTDWSRLLFQRVIKCEQPLVLDADGLNLLAEQKDLFKPVNEAMVLTPHPGEAARLLDMTVAEIEADRFKAVEHLQQRFNATVVLKGAGSLIASGDSRPVAVCSDGNPGMASGGMGDVLSGIIAALLAQRLDADEAACAGVALHAAAADQAASLGEIGMLASDLFAPLRELLNV